MVGISITVGLICIIAATAVQSVPVRERSNFMKAFEKRMSASDDQISAGMLWSPRCEQLISSFLAHLHQVVNTTVSEREQGTGLALLMRAAESDPHLMNCFRTGQASAYIDSMAN